MQVVSSYICLKNMRFRALHGVLEQERVVGGDYVVSLRLRYPIERAMDSDDVADTLNYAEVYEQVREEMMIPSQLLEHVAGRIARRLLRCYTLLEGVELTLTKTTPPMGADSDGACVELHVQRDNLQ